LGLSAEYEAHEVLTSGILSVDTAAVTFGTHNAVRMHRDVAALYAALNTELLVFLPTAETDAQHFHSHSRCSEPARLARARTALTLTCRAD
jgi:hypothetical protein